MSNIRFALEDYLDKNINVIMIGSGGAQPGKLLSVDNGWFVMETRWSNRHYFDTNHVSSFWVDENQEESK